MRIPATSAVVAVGLSLAGLTASAQTIQINQQNKTIAISTSDEATATADIAAITIGFEIYKPDYESATAEAGKTSHAVMEALHKAGIDDKSIESKTQSISRNTTFDEKENASQRAQRLFHAEQSWEITTSPQHAGAVIRLAIAAGANESGQIDWRLADRKALQAQAAANALVKSRAVASQMADGLHVKLGALIYASNETPNAKIYFRRSTETVTVSSAMAVEVPIGPPLEIRPQTIREEATVYAVFSIE